jgi:hypothetical protein
VVVGEENQDLDELGCEEDDENQDLDELGCEGVDLLDRIIKMYMIAATIIAETIIVDALDFKASPKYDARYSFLKRFRWIYKV